MEGTFGIVYIISIEGAKPVCLKIFKKMDSESPRHGKQIEPQVGLFLNKHSDEFVKMYFGKVAGKNNNDAFLITQYLAPGITPEKGAPSTKYSIYHADERPDNMVSETYIDYGGVYVYEISDEKNNKRPTKILH